MKRVLALLLVFACIIGLVGCSGSSATPAAPASGQSSEAASQAPTQVKKGEFVMKMGYGAAPGHPIDLGAQEFKKLVEERTNGRVEVRLFPSAQLGSERQTIEGLQTGTFEGTPTTTGPMGMFDNKFMVFDLPYIFSGYEAADKILDGEVGDELFAGLEEIGLVGLAWWETGFRQLSNNKREVVLPSDVAGLKLRVMENEVHMEFWKNLKTTPVAMGFGEIYMACKSGTVDGQDNPISLYVSNKFYEVQNYVTMTDYVYSPVPVLVSKIWWDTLPEDIQKILKDTAYEVRIMQREAVRSMDEEYIKTAEANGTKVTRLTEEQKAVWKEEALKIYPQFEEKIGKDLMNKVLELSWGK